MRNKKIAVLLKTLTERFGTLVYEKFGTLTVETFLAGAIFAIATTFILIGSIKLLPAISTYTNFLLRFPATFESLSEQVSALDEKFEKKFDVVDKRFDAVDKKFDERFDAVDKRFDAVDKKFDERFDAVDERFDDADKMVADLRLTTDQILLTVNPMADMFLRSIPVVGQLDHEPVTGIKRATWTYLNYEVDGQERLAAVGAVHCALLHGTDHGIGGGWDQQLTPRAISR